MIRWYILLFATLGLATAAHAQSAAVLAPANSENSYERLGNRFGEQLQAMDWGDGTVAVLIEDAALPVKAYAQNESQVMEPGGLIQIVTAAAALARLGGDFHFNTTLAIGGPIEDHDLKGGVVVAGDGDPTLSTLFMKDRDDVWELFDRWAKLLRKKGIKKISGSIVGDDRAFDDQWQAPGWPPAPLGSPDLPSIAALNFNHNCIDIFWRKSKRPAALAECEVFPKVPQYVFLANNVKVEGEGARPRQYQRERDSNVIQISGSLPLRTEAHDRAAIEDPARFFAEALKARLTERKIEVTGVTVSGNKVSPPQIPANLSVLDTHPSPPLRQILAEMMRYDLTLHAEVVFKALGRQAGAKLGSFESGQEAVRGFVDQLHLPGSLWNFADGSGRSRMSRISPAQLLALMRAMKRQDAGRTFEALFPRAWEPGTLAERLRPVELAAQEEKATKEKKPKQEKPKEPKEAPPIWAKSGSAEGTEALAGYVMPRFGRRLAFAIVVNGSRLPADVLRFQIDSLVLGLTQ